MKYSAPTATTPTSTNTTRQGSKNAANKRRGCRCGNATATPGKLTCCGQRCPCYVDSKSCIGCKCRGCRNPHRPGGGKVRPIIPELTGYENQMVGEQEASITSNQNKMPLTMTFSQSNGDSLTNPNTQQNIKSTTAVGLTVKAPSTSLSTSKTVNMSNATLIPLRGFQQRIATPVSSFVATGNNIVGTNHNRNILSNPISIQTNTIPSSNDSSNNNILQLDQLPRESVLIQNADGKYQGKISFVSHLY